MFFYLLGLVVALFAFMQIPAFGVEEPPRVLFVGEYSADARAHPAKSPVGGAQNVESRSARGAGAAKLPKRKAKTRTKAGAAPAVRLQTKEPQGKESPPAPHLLPQAELRKEFNGFLIGSPSGPGRRRVALADGSSFSFDEPLRAFVPFLGSGFFKYQKVGGLLEYVSASAEVLWKKGYAAYPYSDPTGKLLLFVSGDANDAILGDENGTDIARSAGDFMSHHCFAARARRVGLSFSGSAFRVLDEKGTLYLNWTPKERFFLKTCALSDDGGLAAIHFDEGGADWIAVFEIGAGKEASRRYRFKLDGRYPHLLSMALGRHGLLIGTPERVLFFDDDGDLIWTKKTRRESFYRPTYAADDWFAYGVGDDLLVLDAKGRRLTRIRTTSAGAPFRIHAARSRNMLAVQSGGSLLFLRVIPPGG